MRVSDLENRVHSFLEGRTPSDRYASFDYCYNYFRQTPLEAIGRNMERSALTIMAFLSSWGMYRGSSFLRLKSVKHFEKLIIYISSLDRDIWDIDVDQYDELNIKKILKIYIGTKETIISNKNADKTLTTKIMLGIFGMVPAYDRFFCNTFQRLSSGRCGFSRFNATSLEMISEFYECNCKEIDRLSNEIQTISFNTGMESGLYYTKAKIIDMYGYMCGR